MISGGSAGRKTSKQENTCTLAALCDIRVSNPAATIGKEEVSVSFASADIERLLLSRARGCRKSRVRRHLVSAGVAQSRIVISIRDQIFNT